MKIVQSYWSKPNSNSVYNGMNTGGWADSVFFYMSWALSCLKFSEYYDNIELVTDQKGKELLIDILELPYTSVNITLDDLNEYDPDLWAIGKVYAYSIQKEPFIHVDYDVYIWGKFSDDIECASLVAQHKEMSYNHNQIFYEDVEHNLSYIPKSILDFRGLTKEIVEVNAGILGGQDLSFIREYTKEAFLFIDKNHKQLGKLAYKGMFNTIFEQYLFYCLANEKKVEIQYLIKEDISDNFEGLADFSDIYYGKTFIHTVGHYKKYLMIGEQVSYRLLYEYPEYYYRILNLYNKGVLL